MHHCLSKIAPTAICITCICTENKKHLDFDHQTVLISIGRRLLLPYCLSALRHRIATRFTPSRWTSALFGSLYPGYSLHPLALTITPIPEGRLWKTDSPLKRKFEQCQDLQENKYSVNNPMRYNYKGKFRRGWVNNVNPYRALVVAHHLCKTFSIIEPIIRQHSRKVMPWWCTTTSSPTLAQKLYYHHTKDNQKSAIILTDASLTSSTSSMCSTPDLSIRSSKNPFAIIHTAKRERPKRSWVIEERQERRWGGSDLSAGSLVQGGRRGQGGPAGRPGGE